MDNCTYDKIKVMHEISKLMGFIKKHAKEDAKSAKHSDCLKMYDKLYNELSGYLKQFQSVLAKCKF